MSYFNMSGYTRYREEKTMAKQKTFPQTVTIKRNEHEPENMELVAKSIIEIADALKPARLIVKDKLLVLLLHDMTGVPKRSIQLILDVLPNIAGHYLVKGGR
jgi:hypothetical protein